MLLSCSLISALVLLPVSSLSQGRTCCKYSCGTDKQGECPAWCHSDQDCVARDKAGLLNQVLQNCTVLYDTKKDKTDDSIASCLAQNYDGSSRLGGGEDSLPFHIVAYPFIGATQQQSHFTGIDIRYQLAGLSGLRFRIKNTNAKVCPEHGDHDEAGAGLCHPRCVEVEKAFGGDVGTDAFLSYDCEAGFYISRGNWISTTEHDYQLSVCAGQQCGDFLFQLPDLSTTRQEQVVVLVDRREFEEMDRVLMYIPIVPQADSYLIVLVKVGENVTRDVVHNQTHVSSGTGNMMEEVVVDYPLASGRYQLLVTPLKGGKVAGPVLSSCYLTRPDYGQHALATITAILVTVLIVGLVLTLYRRWQAVAEAGAVEPSALVMAGRMEEQAVLIVTPLDNPDHVEVVKGLCRYLRDWCGVGTTYFAMDDETGIGSTQRDPWKWCQETGDKVREKGIIVFIAGPDPGLATNTSIHPNLEHNQAFLTTRHLHQMAGEGRALVAKFSYSSLKTLPQEVPDHLKTSAYHIPKQTNEFLVHLLQVKKKALCTLFPCPLVRPDIKPGDLSRAGGPDLLLKIRELTLKEAHYRLEAEGEGEKVVNRKTDLLNKPDVGEDTTLLCEEIRNFNKQDTIDKDKTLRVDLEGGLPSTKEMGNRDKMDVEEEEEI
jgi:hypothetical protein